MKVEIDKFWKYSLWRLIQMKKLSFLQTLESMKASVHFTLFFGAILFVPQQTDMLDSSWSVFAGSYGYFVFTTVP